MAVYGAVGQELAAVNLGKLRSGGVLFPALQNSELDVWGQSLGSLPSATLFPHPEEASVLPL